MSETNPKKPGWKTTEFWLTLVAVIATESHAAGLTGDAESTATRIVMAIIGVLAVLGYTASRTSVKKAMMALLPLLLIGTLSACATVGPSGKTLGECSTPLTDSWQDRIESDVTKMVAFGIDSISTKNWEGFARNGITHLAASYGQSGTEMVSCFLGLPNLHLLPIFGNIGGAAGDTDPRVIERLKLLQALSGS